MIKFWPIESEKPQKASTSELGLASLCYLHLQEAMREQGTCDCGGTQLEMGTQGDMEESLQRERSFSPVNGAFVGV